ncbi:SagB family peptide dehydrogenase [Pseudoduganella sp.]|uniref:SagB/ThcOx family dehydrogenase n=1 Tax=Pseudoduganella sp. TaxID=1880898 RepID=UPI0035AFDA6A
MGPKILWVLLPLAVYAALLALAWRGKAPSRLALNVHSSLLLMAYLLTTAGLGLFWVASQQLPVFDWHYLFGYATLLLLSLHLFFNLPTALRWLRQRRPAAAAPQGPGPWRPSARLAAVAGALALAFALGAHWGGRGAGPAGPGPAAGPLDGVQTVLQYHAASSSSRSAVFGHAPPVDWGSQPAPFKSYPALPQIALPRAAPAIDGARSLGAMLRAPAAARGQAPLDLAALGQLLHLTAGITARRGGLALRAAPSSGALFPAELYLQVRRVDGLQPGLYHFNADAHRLARLGDLPASAGQEAPDLLLVVGAVFQRTGYKYRNRAYRYVAADLGHLLENARLAAHYVGAHAALPLLFDEMALARMFGLDGRQEGVIAVVAVNGQAGGAASSAAPSAAASALDLGVTGAVHEATSLAPQPALQPGARPPADAGAIVALPPGAPAAMDLARAILERRSQRRFTTQPLPLPALAAMLQDMAQAPLLSGALQADLVVNRVEGIRPGIYRYLPARHALQTVALGDFAAQARNAALDQDVIGDAAVVLLLSADSGQALRHGARGYRMAFLEAGLMGERWLLGAVARGLGACPVGAFYDEEAAQLVKAPAGRWVLHFAALGRTAPD